LPQARHPPSGSRAILALFIATLDFLTDCPAVF
jgi:hypothetical protein